MLLKQVNGVTRSSYFRLIICPAPPHHRKYIAASRAVFLSPTRAVAKPRAQQPLEPHPSWHNVSQRRDAKKKATAALDDLPQGSIGGNPLPLQDDEEPDYPPLLQQVRNNMLKFSHCVLVTRVGGFYEVC